MRDYVVYNNPDSVGDLYKENPLSVFTNKKVSTEVIGSRVWLIVGEGRPRSYFLRCWFFVDHIDWGKEHGFATKLSGSEGVVFEPMTLLPGDEEWFLSFKKDQGNFAFGFSSIKNSQTIVHLEQIAQL